jgi:Na+-transporting NADH:ubiquinone oxidoreductase subunit NqrD
MTIGIVLLVIGVTCLLINILYMCNSEMFDSLNSDDGTLFFIGAILLAPFFTLGFMIYYLNQLAIESSKNKKKVKR